MRETKIITKRRRVPDWQILQLIDQGCNQAEIAKQLKISPQAVNKRIKNFLIKKWIVFSDAATKDARRLRYTNEKIFILTPQGKTHLLLKDGKIDDFMVLKEIVNDLERIVDKYKFLYELKLREENEPL